MIRRIRRTPQVRRDIISIFNYPYERSPQAAENVFDAIEQTIRSLARTPGVGNRWIGEHPSLTELRYTTVTGIETIRFSSA
jgi:plasmid stabilization system protein ParE